MTEWWSPATAGWIGGLAGSGFGVFGGIIGVALGVLAPRAKGRGLVLGAMGVAGILGAGILGLGVCALMIGQPYHVWYPPLLIGGLSAGLMWPLRRVARMRYEDAERRRLAAQSLRGDA
jgi:MFS family permease